MVGMSKLSSLFSVGFNSVFYGAFYFVKDPIKIEHDATGLDCLTSMFLLILYFWQALRICPSELILILTDSVTINTIHITHTILDIKSKCYK